MSTASRAPVAGVALFLSVALAGLSLATLSFCAAPARAAFAQGVSPLASGPPVRLLAGFRPERFGQATTVSFALAVDPSAGAVPVPLTSVEVGYPRDLGLATSELGLASCAPVALEVEGASACPRDSAMGGGGAVIEVPFGPEVVQEQVRLEIYAAPSPDGYLHLGILAEGHSPVIARIVLSGVLLPGRLQVEIPSITSLPAAADASLVSMHAQLGGALTYTERLRNRTISYRPRGIGLPASCPRHGFHFTVMLAYLDGSASHGATTIPCPVRRGAARDRQR